VTMWKTWLSKQLKGWWYFFGPYAPGTTGTSSTIKTSAASGSVAISKYGAAAVTSTQNGMKFSQDLETIHSFLT
jgi:hypothetical protein